MSDKLTVVEAFAAVMDEVQAVRKGDRNTAQNFSFRGIDSVMNAVGPALRKHGVIITPRLLSSNYRDIEVGSKRTAMREVTVEVEYTVHGPAGDTLIGSAPGEAMDSGDKGTPKAMSVAYRTFLLQSLTIPTDEPDPDATSYERSAPEPADGPVSAEYVAAVRAKCEAAGVDVAEVVKHGTSGRTEVLEEVLRSETAGVKRAFENLAPAEGAA